MTTASVPPKRPSRWSPANWPVRWKVLAIVLVPLLLAATFGGLRVANNVTEYRELRLAAQRSELIPDINGYMAALEGAVVTATEGGDTQTALGEFDTAKAALREQLDATDVIPDVRLAVNTLLDYGQNLVNGVMANSVDLRQRVLTYAPLLLTAETAITGSTRSDEQDVQLRAQALSRAIGARGQMAMQQMLVNRGGEVAEPELRTAMITLAGTEPSTVSGMAELLGGASQEAAALRTEMLKRMSLISNPAVPLVGNPELLQSQAVTAGIAEDMIADTTGTIPAAVASEAAAQRSAAIRDAAVITAVMIVALLLVLLVARSLVAPLRRLRDSALKVAHEDLARELDRVRAGGEPGPVTPIPVYTTEEVGQVAHAVDELHEQAVLLAGEQAQLQGQVSDMFETLSRRSRSLVDQQLTLIDRLERNEDDPERLESLFRLDHLAARMRRNGANLLVLSGARIPRDQAEPVPVATIVNAAASEVEDYARVVTATVPDSAVVGHAAGDLIHLLAELLDNALRYSPPISQVRVSAVHTGSGGLVIEVSDIGLGMAESDLRVANARLQSGGEVNPYTARHMGLFVVGRLAAQHGFVVRLRATVVDEPNSGTTAGVYVPAELLVRAGEPAPRYPEPQPAPAFAEPERHDVSADVPPIPEQQLNGHGDLPAGLLPQRRPGASGIAEIPSPMGAAAPQPAAEAPAEWPEDTMPAQSDPRRPMPTPTNTSAFFNSRAQAAGNGVHPPVAPPEPESEPATKPEPVVAAGPPVATPSPTAGADDAIYQSMLSEWLVDPTEIANSSDLDWKSVWDHGWSAAAAADEAPVRELTDEGLPVRDPGARLVPGSGVPNGEAHRGGAERDEVASAAEFDTGGQTAPRRDPEAVRASMSSHFGGVHAGRAHARENRGTDFE
ncbi:HAMP domain-containing protein [Mycobacterium sp. PS03-16]|uniref:sensor histidine kinase n=1 Tax=Mycobacterium sp. PS03-16 TaxID=2559611 RepID=UPI0010745DDA|nr:ATP-binding protein [Mycobacterium sp. PS03-16]TFV56831.1 HAMP domain-containing protein [Mycobacterium sp. PS03-16]